MQKIILDFDGTLIDSRYRLFSLFTFLVPNSTLTFEEYWVIKGRGISHADILKNTFNYEDNEILLFQKRWLELIEDDFFLKTDEPIKFVTETLIKLKMKGFDLVLLTARQYPKKVEQQLLKFNWSNLFKDVLVTQQIFSKEELIIKSNYRNEAVMMIGDTGLDIKTANNLDIFSVAVLSGFQSKITLKKYDPKLIVNTVNDVFVSLNQF